MQVAPPAESDADAVSMTASAFESLIEDFNREFDADVANARDA